MHPLANLGHGLVAALILLTVALVVAAQPLTVLASTGSPGGM
jgi:hypothetical protein